MSTSAGEKKRDAHHSLGNWSKLSKTELRSKAEAYGISEYGTKRSLAARLFGMFHSNPAPEAEGQAVSDAEDAPGSVVN